MATVARKQRAKRCKKLELIKDEIIYRYCHEDWSIKKIREEFNNEYNLQATKSQYVGLLSKLNVRKRATANEWREINRKLHIRNAAGKNSSEIKLPKSSGAIISEQRLKRARRRYVSATEEIFLKHGSSSFQPDAMEIEHPVQVATPDNENALMLLDQPKISSSILTRLPIMQIDNLLIETFQRSMVLQPKADQLSSAKPHPLLVQIRVILFRLSNNLFEFKFGEIWDLLERIDNSDHRPVLKQILTPKTATIEIVCHILIDFFYIRGDEELCTHVEEHHPEIKADLYLLLKFCARGILPTDIRNTAKIEKLRQENKLVHLFAPYPDFWARTQKLHYGEEFTWSHYMRTWHFIFNTILSQNLRPTEPWQARLLLFICKSIHRNLDPFFHLWDQSIIPCSAMERDLGYYKRQGGGFHIWLETPGGFIVDLIEGIDFLPLYSNDHTHLIRLVEVGFKVGGSIVLLKALAENDLTKLQECSRILYGPGHFMFENTGIDAVELNRLIMATHEDILIAFKNWSCDHRATPPKYQDFPFIWDFVWKSGDYKLLHLYLGTMRPDLMDQISESILLTTSNKLCKHVTHGFSTNRCPTSCQGYYQEAFTNFTPSVNSNPRLYSDTRLSEIHLIHTLSSLSSFLSIPVKADGRLDPISLKYSFPFLKRAEGFCCLKAISELIRWLRRHKIGENMVQDLWKKFWSSKGYLATSSEEQIREWLDFFSNLGHDISAVVQPHSSMDLASLSNGITIKVCDKYDYAEIGNSHPLTKSWELYCSPLYLAFHMQDSHVFTALLAKGSTTRPFQPLYPHYINQKIYGSLEGTWKTNPLFLDAVDEKNLQKIEFLWYERVIIDQSCADHQNTSLSGIVPRTYTVELPKFDLDKFIDHLAASEPGEEVQVLLPPGHDWAKYITPEDIGRLAKKIHQAPKGANIQINGSRALYGLIRNLWQFTQERDPRPQDRIGGRFDIPGLLKSSQAEDDAFFFGILLKEIPSLVRELIGRNLKPRFLKEIEKLGYNINTPLQSGPANPQGFARICWKWRNPRRGELPRYHLPKSAQWEYSYFDNYLADNTGITLLHGSVEYCNLDSIVYLLSQNANIYARFRTIEFRSGFDKTQRVSNQDICVTPVELAVQERRIDVVSLFLEARPECWKHALNHANRCQRTLMVKHINEWLSRWEEDNGMLPEIDAITRLSEQQAIKPHEPEKLKQLLEQQTSMSCELEKLDRLLEQQGIKSRKPEKLKR